MRQSLSSEDATSTATGDRPSPLPPATVIMDRIHRYWNLCHHFLWKLGCVVNHCAFNSRLGRGGCVCWGNLDHVLMLLAEERLRKQMFCAPFFSAFVEEKTLFSSSIGFPKHRNSVYLLGSLKKGHESTTSCI